MAKRKRLTPAQPGYLTSDPLALHGGIEAQAPDPAPQPGGLALARAASPIARVAGDAATVAALEEVSAALQSARSEGRLIQKLPLASVVSDHLLRDRLEAMGETLAEEDRGEGAIGEDMAALLASLRARGQQTPIEVMAIGEGRYGLISGWRRLQALTRLHAETGDARFGEVLAILRQPADASDAYVAMVEENEIRVGLSHYERARVVARAVEAGVFADTRQALQALFASGSRARRSKIGSFLTVVQALDGTLRFPRLLGERLGLALAQALVADPALAGRLRSTLAAAAPATAEAEQALLTAGMRRQAAPQGKPTPEKPQAPVVTDLGNGVSLQVAGQAGQQRLVLSGPGVDEALRARLVAWLGAGPRSPQA
jgi:ParB family transcriptional regulator, chromosome partitioning protein